MLQPFGPCAIGRYWVIIYQVGVWRSMVVWHRGKAYYATLRRER